MKRRVVSFIFVFTLVVTMLGGEALRLQASEKSMEPLVFTKASDVSKSESSPLNVKEIVTSDTKKAAKRKYYVEAKQFVLAPIKTNNSGILWLDYDAVGKGCAEIWVLESYEIVDGRVEGMGYDFGECYGGDEISSDGGVPITAGKTYWLYMQNNSKKSISINVRGDLYLTNKTRTLSEGTTKWTIASGMSRTGGTTDIYYKINPSKTGYISVALKAYGSGKSCGRITLYNRNKEKLSNAVNYESGLSGTDGKVYFGVTKGNAYYLRVANVSDGAYWAYKYGIRYSVYSGTDRAIGTKLTAKRLTRKADATKTLLRANGKSSTDWYKISVTSKRKTQIKIDTSRIKSGDVTITFYKGSKKIGASDTIPVTYNNKTYNITYGPTSGKATSGTYYVKVVKSPKTSGLYTIRYVQ